MATTLDTNLRNKLGSFAKYVSLRYFARHQIFQFWLQYVAQYRYEALLERHSTIEIYYDDEINLTLMKYTKRSHLCVDDFKANVSCGTRITDKVDTYRVATTFW